MQVLSIDNLQVNIVRKKIKNFYLKVHTNGCISLSVPVRAEEQAITKFVQSKLEWLINCTQKFSNVIKQTKRKYITGERYFYLGNCYSLNIIKSHQHEIQMTADKLDLYINERSPLTVKYLLNTWYKQEIDIRIRDLLAKWQPLIGVKADSYQIKNMKSRWGSCHIENKVITINLELIKMPAECLEYVVVHELVHLLEASHNHRFKNFMDQYLPAWRQIKKSLNDFSRQHDIGMI